MKTVLLLANCLSPTLQKSKMTIIKVLKELEVEVEIIELERLSYYKDKIDKQAEAIALKIQESSGVIGIASVHIAGMHSTMQNFFEHMMHYEVLIGTKPMFALTYSNCIGEKQAANKMIEAWGMLGGSDGGAMALNGYTDFETVQDTLEKNIEAFYRIMRQGRTVVMSSERKIYLMTKEFYTRESYEPISKKQVQLPEEKVIKTLAGVLNEEQSYEQDPIPNVDLSTKEQNIKELTQLLKSQMNQGNEDQFINISQGIYGNPRVQKEMPRGGKKLQNIPHYFVSQHDRTLDITIQYLITDTGEKGVIYIKEGDCNYREGQVDSPTVELTTTSEILTSILTKEITYQKAFMIGKLKVRGNFIILSKLDQAFKAM